MNPTLERCLGRLLRRVRAGDARLAWNAAGLRDAPAGIALTSPAFADGGAMPQLCAGDSVGDNLSPPLAWSGLPDGTKELVLIVEDPDAPLRRPAVHLIAAGIAPDRAGVPEGALTPAADPSIRFGRGLFRRIGYAGPRPVLGHGPHRYIFQIYALAAPIATMDAPDIDAMVGRMANIVLARGRLTGIYERR